MRIRVAARACGAHELPHLRSGGDRPHRSCARPRTARSRRRSEPVPAGSRTSDARWARQHSDAGRRRLRVVSADPDGPLLRYRTACAAMPRRRILAPAAWSRSCDVPQLAHWTVARMSTVSRLPQATHWRLVYGAGRWSRAVCG